MYISRSKFLAAGFELKSARRGESEESVVVMRASLSRKSRESDFAADRWRCRCAEYLAELLVEQQKLGPFLHVLPICSRLLNQEIIRVSSMVSSQGFYDYDSLHHGSINPLTWSTSLFDKDFLGWRGSHPQRSSVPHGVMEWSPGLSTVKKTMRLEIPVEKYPDFNFVGRILGPRGNSLKRVEACTGCRVYIRGKGSIKDPLKEEKLRGKPSFEHLNDPLHVLIEADLPVNVVDLRIRQAQKIIEELLQPMEESQDFYKRQQLRELTMINSKLREESPGLARGSPPLSPFSNNSSKRTKMLTKSTSPDLLPLAIS